MYTIYALVDPRDYSTRYIGITDNVYGRFEQHIRCSGNNYAKNAWIHELRAQNVMVIMKTLERIENKEEAFEREEYWIQHYQALREPLVNINKSFSPRKAKKALSAKPIKVTDIIHQMPEFDMKEITIGALREIGRRLRNGETRAKILQSYGAKGGRLNQEIGAVVDMEIEQIERGEM